jgi:Fe2+ transport system protein FeoA
MPVGGGLIGLGYDSSLIEMLMPKILETIYSISLSGGKVTLDEVSKRLGVPINFLEDVLKLARERGLVSSDGLNLTDSGKEFILKYRQAFIHDKLIHGGYGVSSLYSGVGEHLKYGHDLSDEDLKSLRSFLSKFDGNIDEVEPLTNLRRGERGIFIYAVGGHGMLRRLSDLGLTPGIEFEVASIASLGGPIVLKVRGYEIALGRGIASRIYVKRLR